LNIINKKEFKMKYKIKIFGVPPEKSFIEIEINIEDTIFDIKKKIIKQLGLNLTPDQLKLVIRSK